MNLPVKKIENRLRFDRIMVMSLWHTFWATLNHSDPDPVPAAPGGSNKSLAKIGRVVSEICARTDIQKRSRPTYSSLLQQQRKRTDNRLRPRSLLPLVGQLISVLVTVSVYFAHRAGALRQEFLHRQVSRKNSNMAQNCADITRIYDIKHKSNKKNTSGTIIQQEC